MKLKVNLTCIIFLLMPTLCLADSKIVCDPPEGFRVDYFNMQNIFNLPNNEFVRATDKVVGMHPTIIFGNNKKNVTFIIGNNSSPIPRMLKGDMAVIYDTQEQISFAGVINEAPVLASYYPGMHILVYSQQSDWMPVERGMRSGLYFSRCSE